MQQNATLRLFKRGPTPEFRLLVVVLLSLVLLFVDARWSVLDPVRRVVSVAIYPFQRLAMAPRDVIELVDNWMNAATLARTEKEALQRQRIELAQLSSHAAQLATENLQLRRLLSVTELGQQQSIAVEVLYEPANAFNHHLIFNKGTTSGIAPGMPVIDEGGVVGQVIRVTPFTSEAALLTDDKVSVPVQVVRNGLRLIAFGGNPEGKVEVRYLTANADIQPGDTLVTSGIGGLFPAGLAVGRVDEVRHDTVSGFAVALVTPSSHPERYRHFLVLSTEAARAAANAEGDNAP
ncbi:MULTISPECIES: rod shape-determining protein MreC [unclassified Pusillimonas]|uniref:rod shape-determining protein MreC n=1 Tax=unclassified Pusillimonas TaxID=2640016 RepID=UPI000B9CE0FD|nr:MULTISPECIES: rod shape-determining protein MreC [unclassified Pusillimonas]OXR49975.1 rod shape-determining protein MreC [Pusillimonas sp. T2]ROT46643.1 rod shape-determining protein MreC [Pusillimonas sp. NJUB218]